MFGKVNCMLVPGDTKQAAVLTFRRGVARCSSAENQHRCTSDEPSVVIVRQGTHLQAGFIQSAAAHDDADAS